jgi:hypothetical protein
MTCIVPGLIDGPLWNGLRHCWKAVIFVGGLYSLISFQAGHRPLHPGPFGPVLSSKRRSAKLTCSAMEVLTWYPSMSLKWCRSRSRLNSEVHCSTKMPIARIVNPVLHAWRDNLYKGSSILIWLSLLHVWYSYSDRKYSSEVWSR